MFNEKVHVNLNNGSLVVVLSIKSIMVYIIYNRIMAVYMKFPCV